MWYEPTDMDIPMPTPSDIVFGAITNVSDISALKGAPQQIVAEYNDKMMWIAPNVYFYRYNAVNRIPVDGDREYVLLFVNGVKYTANMAYKI